MANRIRYFREAKGWTQADLAEALGVGWQTVQGHEAGKRTLSRPKREAYAEALGASVDELFPLDTHRTVRVMGPVQAGSWAESWEFPEDDQYTVAVPNDEALSPYRLFGAETRGPSMNRRYPEGTVLIFTDAIETQEDLVFGKRYIVERQRADGLREATVKTLWRDAAGAVWLIPDSDDPRFQTPIPLEGSEDDTIRIVGRVRYAVSRE